MTTSFFNELLSVANLKAEEIFSTINSRDVAIALWVGILFLSSLVSEKIRGPLLSLVQCAFQFKLVVIYLFVAAYTTACLVVLDHYGVFTAYQVKPAVLWMFTVAFTPMFKLKRFQEDLGANLVLLVKSGLTYLAVVSFYIGLRPFNLWVEFLFGVPLLFILGAMRAVAEAQGVARVVSFVDLVFLVILVVVAVWTGVDVYSHPEYYSLGTLTLDFGVPIFLTFMYLPFAILFTVVCTYETMFIRLNFNIASRGVALYAKLAALVVFNVNIKLANRWFRMLSLRGRQSFSDINASLVDMVKIWWAERTQGPVLVSDGWAPKEARAFLKEFDLRPGDYNWVAENVFAAEAATTLDDLNSLCNVTYRIRGIGGCVKKVVLSLSSVNIRNPPELSETKRDLIQYFSSLSQYLWDKALGDAMPDEFVDSILHCAPVSLEADEYRAVLDYETSDHRYEIKLTITKENWSDC